jgi:hypothetical protein
VHRFPGPGEVLFVEGLQDLGVLELGDVLLDGVVELETTFLPQHHDRCCGDGFALRCDSEDVVAFERPSGGVVGGAEGLEVDDLAAAGGEGDHAGDVAVGHGVFAH